MISFKLSCPSGLVYKMASEIESRHGGSFKKIEFYDLPSVTLQSRALFPPVDGPSCPFMMSTLTLYYVLAYMLPTGRFHTWLKRQIGNPLYYRLWPIFTY
jgi:hypothetical protein